MVKKVSAIINGRLMEGEELMDYCRKHGMCTTCGKRQTHKKAVFGFGRVRLEPIELEKDEHGDTIVYKGHCISPTCYTSVEQVNAILMGKIDSPLQQRPGGGGLPRHVSDGSNNASNPMVSPSSAGTSRRSFVPPPGLYQPSMFPPPLRGTQSSAPAIGGGRDAAGNRTQLTYGRKTSVGALDEVASAASTPPTFDAVGMSSFGSNTSYTSSNSNSQHQYDRYPSPRLSHHQVLRPRSGDLIESKEEEVVDNPHVQAAVGELEELITQGAYIQFLNELDSKGSDKAVALEGLRLLRSRLVENHMALDGCQNWTKTIHDRMTMIRGTDGRSSSGDIGSGDARVPTSDSDRDIVVSGLLVFLTLSTLPSSYRKDMLSKGSARMALTYLDAFKGQKDVCDATTALFLSLSLKEKDGINSRYKTIRIHLERLVRLVCSGEYGRDCAIRSLFYLSHQKKRPGTGSTQKSLSHDIKAMLGTDHNISALFGILKERNLREQTAESVLSLLWRMSIPRDEEQTDGLLPVSEDAIMSLVRCMEMFESIAIRESSCGILSNISMRANFPFHLVRPCFQAINQFLVGSNLEDEGLAICSSHAICNMLASDSSRKILLFDQGILETTTKLLRQYSKSEEIVENCCLALAHAGRDDYTVKDAIVRVGGFSLVKEAFKFFVISKGDEQSFEVKDASLCAIATISGCHTGVEAIKDDGFLDMLQALLAVETDSDFAQILEVIIENCLNSNPPDLTLDGGPQVNYADPELFAKRVEDASEPKLAAVIFQAMTGSGKSMMDTALAENGFSAMTNAMSRFLESEIVQEHGCALLAGIYFYPPSDTEYRQTDVWSRDCLSNALDTIHKAMGYHRRNPDVYVNACLAIVNICAGVSEVSEDVSTVIPVLFDDALDGLRYHTSHRPSVQNGVLALLGLIDIGSSGTFDLARRGDNAVRCLSDSIVRFPNDSKIHVSVLDVLLRLQNENVCTSLIGSPPVIDQIRVLVSSDTADVAGRASASLACLVDVDFAAASYIMENPDSVRHLVSAMAIHPEDLHLQINLCYILSSLINFGADFVAQMQNCAEDCLKALCRAINLHRRNTELIKHACCVVASFFPTFSEMISRETNDSTLSALLLVMDVHVEEAEVESTVFDALFSMTRSNDDVKALLLEESRFKAIIAIMGVHIGAVEVQRSGCSLLCSLSSYRPGKAAMGKDGIGTLVNALLAHNQSTAVQKEGLLALKSLATESDNKQYIAVRGGEDAVLYSLWIHYRDPSVISTGLSALNNIAVDGATRTVSQMKDQILTITIGAMSRFGSDLQVQKNACFYLKSCSYLPENLQMMADHSEQLIPLLIQAASNFPDQCEARAHGIIEKLQPLC